MNKIYHKSKQAIYFDVGDGSLYVTDYKGNNRASGAPNTIAWTKNDAQGWEYIKALKIKRGVTKFNYLYRCPNDNQPYSKGSWSRRGSVKKSRGLVVSVRP